MEVGGVGEPLMGGSELVAAVERVAALILGEFRPAAVPELALVGIQLRGPHLARRVAGEIERRTGVRPRLGALDISMYRDDVGLRRKLPLIRETDIPFGIDGRAVVLVDDVLFTGRTVRAALDALTDYGRPSLIRLAVLVDRGGREFPIRPDFTGAVYDIPSDRRICVRVVEEDGVDGVFIKPARARGRA